MPTGSSRWLWLLVGALACCAGCDAARGMLSESDEATDVSSTSVVASAVSAHPPNGATIVIQTAPGAQVEAAVKTLDGRDGTLVTTLKGTADDSGALSLEFVPSVPPAKSDEFFATVSMRLGDSKNDTTTSKFSAGDGAAVEIEGVEDSGTSGRCELIWTYEDSSKAFSKAEVGDSKTFPVRLVGSAIKHVRFRGRELEPTPFTAQRYAAGKRPRRKVRLQTRAVELTFTKQDLESGVKVSGLGSDSARAMFPVEADLIDGTTLVGEVGCRIASPVAFAKFEKTPYALELPGDGTPYRGQGALVFTDGGRQRAYGDTEGPPHALRYLAIARDTKPRTFSDCVYKVAGTGELRSAARVARGRQVEIYDRRTAKLVAKRKFSGAKPKCEAVVSSTNRQRTGVGTKVIDDWLEQWAKDNLGTGA